MHKAIAITAIGVLSVSQALAGFEVEDSVFRIDKLQQAKEKAEAEGLPITFMYSNEHTNCGLCSSASANILDTLEHESVLVYVEHGDLDKLPKIARKAINSPEAKKYIPKTVVLDPEIEKVIAILPYAVGDKQDDLLDEVEDAIEEAMPGGGGSGGQSKRAKTASMFATVPADENRETRTWHSKSGAEVRASLVKEKRGHVVLKKEDGAYLKISPTKLSDEDQEYVNGLKR